MKGLRCPGRYLPLLMLTVASLAHAAGPFGQAGGRGNHPPVIYGAPVTSVAAGASYYFRPSAVDEDGDPLRFTIYNKPAWAYFDANTGTLSGAPPASAVGTHAGITILVSDGISTAALPSFSITVTGTSASGAPRISGAPAASVKVGQQYFFQPVASDPNGDALTFQIVNRPPWANFDPATGRLSGYPKPTDAGIHGAITISVSDGRETASLAAFSVHVIAQNSAPTIAGTPPVIAQVGRNYTFTPTAVDADADTLRFSVVNLPRWARFNPANGQITGTPTTGDVGTYTGIQVSVSDGTTTRYLPAFSIRVEMPIPGRATLSWTAPTRNEDGSPLVDLAGFRIFYKQPTDRTWQSVVITNPSVSSHVFDNLRPGQWHFVARSFNSHGVHSRDAFAARTVY